MKIMMASLSFEPDGISEYPGVNRYAIGLVKALTYRGIQVRVVTPMRGSQSPFERWNDIEIVRIKDTKSLFGRIGTVAFSNLLSFGVNLQHRPELFDDINLLQTDIPLPSRGPLLQAVPLVYVIHHTYRVWTGGDLLWTPMAIMAARNTAKAADAVVTPSQTVAQEASKEYDIPPSKIRAIYHGVDAGLFQPSSHARPYDEDSRSEILYVGLLEKRKGIAELLTAFTRVRAAEPRAKLILIGRGPERAKVIETCARFNLADSVLIRENLSDSELVLEIDRADVFVLPSMQEGFGFAAVEAMACGKPVVGFDTPINREVIGNGGILVPKGDSEALASAIRALITDPALARTLGATARRIVTERYDWKTTAEEYHKVYESFAAVERFSSRRNPSLKFFLGGGP